MPPHRPPIRGYLTDRHTHNGIFCPRPEVRIPVLIGYPRRRSLPTPFIIDTGSDVTLIPITFARANHVVGYDRATARTTLSTSLNGQLEGYWGTVSVQVRDRQSELACFYYLAPRAASVRIAGGRGDRQRVDAQEWPRWLTWVSRFVDRFRPGHTAVVDRPLVLGRAGFYDSHSLVIQDGWVGISDLPFLDIGELDES